MRLSPPIHAGRRMRAVLWTLGDQCYEALWFACRLHRTTVARARLMALRLPCGWWPRDLDRFDRLRSIVHYANEYRRASREDRPVRLTWARSEYAPRR